MLIMLVAAAEPQSGEQVGKRCVSNGLGAEFFLTHYSSGSPTSHQTS